MDRIVLSVFLFVILAVVAGLDFLPLRCRLGHRKKRTLRTRPWKAALASNESGYVVDINECSRCGAAYEVTREESAAEYAERTKLGEAE